MEKENKKNKNHKFLPHTADIKFQAYGRTIEEAFSNALIAMSSAMYDGKVERVYMHKAKVKGKDIQNLLYNFLEEFIFLFDTKKMLVAKVEDIKIDLKKFELECTITGDNAEKYRIETALKAVTYNDMLIKQIDGKWMIQVVLDS